MLTAYDVDGLAGDDPMRRYVQALQGLPHVEQAEAADYAFQVTADRIFVLWHEPSTWVTRTSLGLYSFERELRRLAGVLPLVYPDLPAQQRIRREARYIADVPEEEPGEVDDERRRPASQVPRPLSPYDTRMEIVDVAPGSFDVLLQAVGSLEDILNSHGVLAVTSAITLASAGRPIARVAIRVIRASARIGKHLTIRTLRRALVTLGDEPHGRSAVVVRIAPDGVVTVVIVDER